MESAMAGAAAAKVINRAAVSVLRNMAAILRDPHCPLIAPALPTTRLTVRRQAGCGQRPRAGGWAAGASWAVLGRFDLLTPSSLRMGVLNAGLQCCGCRRRGRARPRGRATWGQR